MFLFSYLSLLCLSSGKLGTALEHFFPFGSNVRDTGLGPSNNGWIFNTVPCFRVALGPHYSSCFVW